MYYDDYEEALKEVFQLAITTADVTDVTTQFMEQARNTLHCVRTHYYNYGFLPKSPIFRFFLFVLLLVWLFGGFLAWGASARSDDLAERFGGRPSGRGSARGSGRGSGFNVGSHTGSYNKQSWWQQLQWPRFNRGRTGSKGLYDSPVSRGG